MAGDTLPFSEVEDPGIGKAAHMIVGLAPVSSRRVINPGDYRRVAEEIHFNVLNIGKRRLEEGIFNVGKESLLVAEFAIPLGVDEAAGNQRVEGRGIAIHLGLVPQAFQNQKLALARIGLLSSDHSDGGKNQKTADGADHARTRPPHPHVRRTSADDNNFGCDRATELRSAGLRTSWLQALVHRLFIDIWQRNPRQRRTSADFSASARTPFATEPRPP